MNKMTAKQYEKLLILLNNRIADACPFEQASVSIAYQIALASESATVVTLFGFVEYGQQCCCYKSQHFILVHRRLEEDGYPDRKVKYGLRELREKLNLSPIEALAKDKV